MQPFYHETYRAVIYGVCFCSLRVDKSYHCSSPVICNHFGKNGNNWKFGKSLWDSRRKKPHQMSLGHQCPASCVGQAWAGIRPRERQISLLAASCGSEREMSDRKNIEVGVEVYVFREAICHFHWRKSANAILFDYNCYSYIGIVMRPCISEESLLLLFTSWEMFVSMSALQRCFKKSAQFLAWT